MPLPPRKDIPEFARRCWQQYNEAFSDIREQSEISKKMWLGGEHQWLPEEISQRKSENRPYVTLNAIKPACDQVVNEARNNPPGPRAIPVGGTGSDKDGADILEGIIREYQYRSDADTAYLQSMEDAVRSAVGGVFELATEYEEGSVQKQRILVKRAEDPDMYFYDTNARGVCREDAMFQGKIRKLTKDQIIEAYPNVPGIKHLKIFESNGALRSAAWMQSALGWTGNAASAVMWMGGTNNSEGPYFVCEFYLVEVIIDKITLYTDNIERFDDEMVPPGVTIKMNDAGEPQQRTESRRKIWKYLVTALDVIGEPTEWMGDIIPFFWVFGPEIYIKGKLYRTTLVDAAMYAQRGLNYAATGAVETVSNSTKAPWIGWTGQFNRQNAQGEFPWAMANRKNYAFLELEPTWTISPDGSEKVLLPPPQRNAWESPIARLLELATFFREQIKSATSVFFDPTIQRVSDVQSGEAIKALQSQTNVGTLHWQHSLHRAVQLSYQQATIIAQKILSAEQVVTIVRPDKQSEVATINEVFTDDEGKQKLRKNVSWGKFNLRVEANGVDAQTRAKDAVVNTMELARVAPNMLAQPAVMAQVVRLVGDGNPKMEQIADTIMGNELGSDATPDQYKAAIANLNQKAQMQEQIIQKLAMEREAKLPELALRKWEAELKALTSLATTEMTATKGMEQQHAELEASMLEKKLGVAHESATQATDQAHQSSEAERQREAAKEQQATDQGFQMTMAEQAAEQAKTEKPN